MIRVLAYKRENAYIGFSVSGHAGFAEYGKDIVCASVTSAVQLTVNGICEILGQKADVTVKENEIALRLFQVNSEAEAFLKALFLHLDLLSQDYIGTIQLTDVEV